MTVSRGKIMNTISAILVVLLVMLAGCADTGDRSTNSLKKGADTFQYIARDSGGSIVVTGSMSILFAETGEISGTWTLEQKGSPDGKIGPQVGTGKLTGRKKDAGVFINLNPEWADNNVFLDGKMEGNRIVGKWNWSTFAGSTSGGAFEATR